VSSNPKTLNVKKNTKKRKRIFLGGGSLPLASAAYGVFRSPLWGALPRNAPKIVMSD
jgi:hypothetical protein